MGLMSNLRSVQACRRRIDTILSLPQPYSGKVLGLGPFAYWPLWEASGGTAEDISGNGFDGTYIGVTLGQDGIGDGNTCPLFDGANDYVNVYSVGFRDVFSGAEGSAMIWAKVFDVGTWTDGNNRYTYRFRVDANNYVLQRKDNANNRLESIYEAGNVMEGVQDNGVSELGFMCLAYTWSKSAGVDGEVKYFRDGSQKGATDTSLGVWAGLLSVTQTVLGAQTNTPADPWYGYLAHCAVWDSALTPAQVADLAVV